MEKKAYKSPYTRIFKCDADSLMAASPSLGIHDEEANSSTVYAPVYKHKSVWDDDDEK